MAYTIDLCVGGTASADSVQEAGYEADKAFDNNTATSWGSANTAVPHWLKYDFGAGVAHKIVKVRIIPQQAYGMTNFDIDGSNNDSDWTPLSEGLASTDDGSKTWDEFIFNNTTAYRYVRIYDNAGEYLPPGKLVSIWEVEMMAKKIAGGAFLLFMD